MFIQGISHITCLHSYFILNLSLLRDAFLKALKDQSMQSGEIHDRFLVHLYEATFFLRSPRKTKHLS